MAELTSASRNKLPDSSFALPNRRYPIHDESHARNALSRVSENGSPEEKRKVRAAVHRKYPNIGTEHHTAKMYKGKKSKFKRNGKEVEE